MLKDPECAARYEESMLAHVRAQEVAKAVRVAQEDLRRLPQVELTPVHRFTEGLYTRELAIPADTFVIGKTHRHEHPVFLLKGKVTIRDVGGGEEAETIEAPRIWTSKPGAKRVLYTHTDCVFATCHASDETDLDKLEAFLIVPETELLEAPE